MDSVEDIYDKMYTTYIDQLKEQLNFNLDQIVQRNAQSLSKDMRKLSNRTIQTFDEYFNLITFLADHKLSDEYYKGIQDGVALVWEVPIKTDGIYVKYKYRLQPKLSPHNETVSIYLYNTFTQTTKLVDYKDAAKIISYLEFAFEKEKSEDGRS